MDSKAFDLLEHCIEAIVALKHCTWTCLVVQWLRICLPRQGTRVRSLVQEDPTCRGATKPTHHNYRNLMCLEPVLRNKKSHLNE